MSTNRCVIKKSKEELAALGIRTTYAVARRADGQFCIIDENLIYGKRTPLLPLHGKVYPDYRSTFDAIVAELAGTGERSEASD